MFRGTAGAWARPDTVMHQGEAGHSQEAGQAHLVRRTWDLKPGSFVFSCSWKSVIFPDISVLKGGGRGYLE